jgi:hypothetical protein
MVLLPDMVLFIQNHAQAVSGHVSVHFESARHVRGCECNNGDKRCPCNLASYYFIPTTEARTASWLPLRATTTLFGPLL